MFKIKGSAKGARSQYHGKWVSDEREKSYLLDYEEDGMYGAYEQREGELRRVNAISYKELEKGIIQYGWYITNEKVFNVQNQTN